MDRLPLAWRNTAELNPLTMRLAVVTNILTPYRVSLFEEMAKRVEALKVLLMARAEPNRSWHVEPSGFASEVLPGLHMRLPGRAVPLHWNIGVSNRLRSFRADAVLSGGFAPANLAALRYCQREGKAFVCFGELAERDARGWGVSRRRYMVSHAEGWIASSSASARAFDALGADAARVLTMPMPLPIDALHQAAREARETGLGETLWPGLTRPLLLAVGRVVPDKGYTALFDIFARLRGEYPGASLLIAGDGPALERYSSEAVERFGNSVRFAGFVDPRLMPAFYAHGDVFVFPTLHDRYGAVLGEAMACEIPVVSSSRAAATEDLVVEGVTGFAMDPDDIPAAAAQIARNLELARPARARLVEAAYQHVRQFDSAPAAMRMLAYLRQVGAASKSTC